GTTNGEGNGAPTAEYTGDNGEKFTVEPDGPGKADLGDVTTQDGSLAYSIGEQEFLSYNGIQSNTYTSYNSAVADRLFGNFWYYGTDGSVVRDEDYGSYEIVSEDPFQVKYTIADDTKWSDGTDVTAADYIMLWAAQNPNIENPDAEANEDGSRPP
ncbi:MAG: ABC transporter family substrate-binding protein, partial [Micrococcus sp.]|nr:ABC transporter family substrate-binding protein [Micrococcus sp.]